MSVRSTIERNVAAHERERLVPAEDARQEACLAQDLEAVADPEHEPAFGGEGGDGLHRGCEPGDRAAAQVVPVREPTRKQNGVEVAATRSRYARRRGPPRRARTSAQSASRSSQAPGKAQHADAGLWAGHPASPRARSRSSRSEGSRAVARTSAPLPRGHPPRRFAHDFEIDHSTDASLADREAELAQRATRPPVLADRGCRPSAERERWPSSQHHLRVCEVIVEPDARQLLERLHVACPCSRDDSIGKLRAGWRLVPPERLAVITDELLVE